MSCFLSAVGNKSKQEWMYRSDGDMTKFASFVRL